MKIFRNERGFIIRCPRVPRNYSTVSSTNNVSIKNIDEIQDTDIKVQRTVQFPIIRKLLYFPPLSLEPQHNRQQNQFQLSDIIYRVYLSLHRWFTEYRTYFFSKPESTHQLTRKFSNTIREDPQKDNKNKEPKDDKPKQKVEEWTTEDVVVWASKYVGEEDAMKLKTQQINGKSLLQLNKQDLQSIGILLGPASILAVEIEILKTPQGIPTEDFALRDPHPLLETEGVVWPFQESPNLHQDLQVLSSHYDNWKRGNTDKGSHPLFLALSGAGTGKSRLLQEFPRLSIKAISENTELTNRLKDAYVFNISFENGTAYDPQQDQTAKKAIANRMLWQLYSRKNVVMKDFSKFVSSFDVQSPSDVIELLSKLLHKKIEDMTIFLILDGLQKLPHTDGRKDTLFYDALKTVASMVNQHSTFIIGCCSATLFVPVSQVLADSPQQRVFLTVPLLDGKKIFHEYLHKPNPILELLIDDMGGHGRALEILEVQWKKFIQAPEIYDISTLMSQLRSSLLQRYPDYAPRSEAAGYMLPILYAVMTKYKFKSAKSIIPDTEWTVDNACSFGLISFNEDPKTRNTLTCSFIWIWLITTPSHKYLYELVTGHYEKFDAIIAGYKANFPTWSQFELFNAHYRCLKSIIYSGQTILMSELHAGAILNGDIKVNVTPLEVTIASKQYLTKSSENIDTIQCQNGSFKVSDGKHFFVGIGNSPSADGWCQITKEPPRRETHQYKLICDGNITESNFIVERNKAADDNDFFIMFSIYKNTLPAQELPTLSGLVTKNNFKDYYGPFAGRMFYMITADNIFSINKATREQLQMMPGIGPERAQQILDKRPFQNLGDCKKRTNIPQGVLELFVFDQK